MIKLLQTNKQLQILLFVSFHLCTTQFILLHSDCFTIIHSHLPLYILKIYHSCHQRDSGWNTHFFISLSITSTSCGKALLPKNDWFCSQKISNLHEDSSNVSAGKYERVSIDFQLSYLVGNTVDDFAFYCYWKTSLRDKLEAWGACQDASVELLLKEQNRF